MFRISLFAASLLASTAAAAQTAPQPDAAVAPRADDIVVTVTRTPTAPDRVAASVTVLDKAAIDRSQDLGITELLLRTPGVTIARNGGYGTATTLRIRGAESDQTVVVIDGVKLNDPSAIGGGFNFANLLTGDVARVEVLRGPQSTLWGSQAIGGVVNIVTPLGERPLEGSFDVESGSRETVSGRAAIGGRSGPLAWRIGGQAFSTEGISAIAPKYGGTERDGYTNRSAMGRALLDVATGVAIDLRGYYSDGRVENDGFNVDSADYSLTREFVGYAGLNVDLLDGRLRNRLGYGYTDTDRENYNPTRARTISFDAAGRNKRYEYQGSFALAPGWDLTFGAERERASFRSVSPAASLAVPIPAPSRAAATLTGFYGQLNAEVVPGVTLTAGVRNDDHSRFGSKTLFAAGGVWTAPWGTVVRANYGEGFKAPSLYQLFSEFGNPNVQPEEADGWEAGAEQRFADGRIRFGGTYFERDTTDQISFFSCAATSPDPLCLAPGSTTARRFGYYYNIARAFTRGIEAVAGVQIGERLTLDGNYSWIDATERTPGANFGRDLARRPRHTANASASYTFGEGGSVGAAVRWSGASFENAANTVRLAPYTLVDLRGELPVTAQVRLFGRVENLFDKDYETAFRYGTIGRSFYAGFRGRF